MTKISALPSITDLVTNDEFAVARGGQSKKTSAANLVWEKILDLPLTVSTDWAMPAGWSTDGSKFIFGGNLTAVKNKYTPRVQQDCFITEVKIWIPSTGRSLSNQRAGFTVSWDGTNTGAATYLIVWINNVIGAASAYQERDAIAAGPSVTISPPIGFDAWHTLRILRAGMATTMFINGYPHGTVRIDSHAAGEKDQSYCALYGYGCDAHFKDFKVWRLRQPV